VNIRPAQSLTKPRRAALALILLPVLLLVLAPRAPQHAQSVKARKRRPPNVVVILIDDMGWADTGVYGSSLSRTPNIDALAARGMRFTDAYAAAPVCSPSRAALLTGRAPARLHLTDWLPGREDGPAQKMLRPPIRQALPREELTLAELLKGAGYVSAHVGKWHLGGEGFGPSEQGFDVNVAGDHHGTPVSYFYPYRRGEEFTPGLEEGRPGEYLTDRLTSEAEAFIERNRDRPFFLELWHYAVHIPMRAKAEKVEKYRALVRPGAPQTNPIYAAMVESVDESVGRVVAKLRELSLLDDTLVVFTSDNGGLHVEEGPNTPATNNAPLRAGKGYLYEGGIRVPFIVQWPSVVRPGAVCAAPVTGTDVFATVAEAAGVRQTTGVDGVSLLPQLKGACGPGRRALYWHYPHYSNQGGRPAGAVRAGRYKLVEFYDGGQVELYDLARDPGETHDISGERPGQALRLKRALERWRARVGAQAMRPNPDYKR
jgi:arylsulfatase A-like enzyme